MIYRKHETFHTLCFQPIARYVYLLNISLDFPSQLFTYTVLDMLVGCYHVTIGQLTFEDYAKIFTEPQK